MFTGIVEGTGTVRAVDKHPDGRRLSIEAPLDGLERGQSIGVSGVCLTVETFDETGFEVFLARETVDRTYLGKLGRGDEVNVERALPADGRLDGHLVQGHVDGVAEVTDIRQVGEDWRFGFTLPPELAPYVVEKGSIAVDGISLTVATLDDERFEVAIIPETYDVTTLASKSVGDPVHLEVDVVAKYVESLLDGYR